MVDDLLYKYNFRGWKREQVVALLGAPDMVPAALGSWDLGYRLGVERNSALPLDDEFLVFKLGHSGVVVEYCTIVE